MNKQALVERTKSVIFVTTLHLTVKGGMASLEGVDDTLPILQLPRDASAEALGAAVLDAMTRCRTAVPHRTSEQRKLHEKAFLGRLGVKSRVQMVQETEATVVIRDGSDFSVDFPMTSISGEWRRFQSPSTAELGKAIIDALELFRERREQGFID